MSDLQDELVASGRYARLDVTSELGEARAVTVGFVAEPDGSLLVAAGSPDASWARSLATTPELAITIGERTYSAVAEPVDDADPDRNRAIRELILRYGTPSESLGRGPVFRLVPSAKP
jgi:hypothetical protein